MPTPIVTVLLTVSAIGFVAAQEPVVAGRQAVPSFTLPPGEYEFAALVESLAGRLHWNVLIDRAGMNTRLPFEITEPMQLDSEGCAVALECFAAARAGVLTPLAAEHGLYEIIGSGGARAGMARAGARFRMPAAILAGRPRKRLVMTVVPLHHVHGRSFQKTLYELRRTASWPGFMPAGFPDRAGNCAAIVAVGSQDRVADFVRFLRAVDLPLLAGDADWRLIERVASSSARIADLSVWMADLQTTRAAASAAEPPAGGAEFTLAKGVMTVGQLVEAVGNYLHWTFDIREGHPGWHSRLALTEDLHLDRDGCEEVLRVLLRSRWLTLLPTGEDRFEVVDMSVSVSKAAAIDAAAVEVPVDEILRRAGLGQVVRTKIGLQRMNAHLVVNYLRPALSSYRPMAGAFSVGSDDGSSVVITGSRDQVASVARLIGVGMAALERTPTAASPKAAIDALEKQVDELEGQLAAMGAAELAAERPAPPQQPERPREQPFVLPAGDIAVTGLVALAGRYLGRNILCPPPLALCLGDDDSVSVPSRIETDAEGCEVALGELLSTRDLAVLPLDTALGLYEVASLNGVRGREILASAPWRTPEQILARSDLMSMAVTFVRVHNVPLAKAADEMRRSAGADGTATALAVVPIANAHGIFLHGRQRTVASALVAVAAMDQAERPAVVDASLEARLVELESRIDAAASRMAAVR